MPKVPTYDSFVATPGGLPSVRAEAPQARNAQPEQTQQLGEGIMRAAEGIGRIALDMKQQADQVKLADTTNQAMGAATQLQYDPSEGYAHLRGDAALTRPDGKALDEEYTSKLKERLDKIAATLGNDTQRRMFAVHSAELLQHFRKGVADHMSREFDTYRAGVQDGTIKLAQQRMSLGWGDADNIAQGANAIKAATYETGRLKGWAPAETEAQTIAALSPAHGAVLQAAVDNGKIGYAREYLQKYNAELLPDAREHAKKLIKQGDFDIKTQQAAADLFTKYPNDPTAALAEARAKTEGKEQDATIQRLKARYDEVATLREKDQRGAADNAWRAYAQTHNIDNIPPSTWLRMDGRDVLALRNTAAKDAAARAAGTEVQTDSNVYYALTQAAAYDPAFAQEDLRRYFDRLSPSDRAHFINLQANLGKPGNTDQVVGVTEQKSAMVKALGLRDKDAGVFHQQADKALYEAKIAKGRTLDQMERQKVLDGLAIQGNMQGAWFTKRAYQARAEGKAFSPAWSDADKQQTTDALKRAGVANPTLQQIDTVLRKKYGVQ